MDFLAPSIWGLLADWHSRFSPHRLIVLRLREAEIKVEFRFLTLRTLPFLNGDGLIDKPHFAATPESDLASRKFALPSTIRTSAAVGNNPTNGAQVTDAGSNATLDFESATALRKFFELLDEWDHKEEQP